MTTLTLVTSLKHTYKHNLLLTATLSQIRTKNEICKPYFTFQRVSQLEYIVKYEKFKCQVLFKSC
jgi:hypothetical protein